MLKRSQEHPPLCCTGSIYWDVSTYCVHVIDMKSVYIITTRHLESNACNSIPYWIGMHCICGALGLRWIAKRNNNVQASMVWVQCVERIFVAQVKSIHCTTFCLQFVHCIDCIALLSESKVRSRVDFMPTFLCDDNLLYMIVSINFNANEKYCICLIEEKSWGKYFVSLNCTSSCTVDAGIPSIPSINEL